MDGVPLMDRDGLEEKAALEDTHWWFRGRRRIVMAALGRMPLPHPCRTLDAGCGSGRMLDELEPLGELAGIDVNPAAVAAARERGHAAVTAELTALPYEDSSFDLVVCLDVLEHVQAEAEALAELARVTRPRGFALVSVPAWPLLWSSHDRAAAHVRRYTRSRLLAIAAAGGWRPACDTYFNAALLPPIAAVRLGDRALRRFREARAPGRSQLRLTPPSLDSALEAPLRAEARLIARGQRLPLGLSLLVVLRRDAPAA